MAHINQSRPPNSTRTLVKIKFDSSKTEEKLPDLTRTLVKIKFDSSRMEGKSPYSKRTLVKSNLKTGEKSPNLAALPSHHTLARPVQNQMFWLKAKMSKSEPNFKLNLNRI